MKTRSRRRTRPKNYFVFRAEGELIHMTRDRKMTFCGLSCDGSPIRYPQARAETCSACWFSKKRKAA